MLVLGENDHVQRREKTDLIGHNLFKIEYVDGNKLKSHCCIDENMSSLICQLIEKRQLLKAHVREWVTNFISLDIHFPSLEMEYYDDSVFLALAIVVARLMNKWWGNFGSKSIGSKWNINVCICCVRVAVAMGMLFHLAER
ncbi:hypothetical protein HKD37_07G017736 [Glycine soja]